MNSDEPRQEPSTPAIRTSQDPGDVTTPIYRVPEQAAALGVLPPTAEVWGEWTVESTSINVSNIILASLVGSTRSPEPTVDDLVLIRPEVFTHRALRTM